MRNKFLVTLYIISTLLLTVLPSNIFAGEEGGTADMIRKITPPISVIKEVPEKKDRIFFDSYYEPNLIIQGNRTGRWSELTNTFGYIHNNVQGYFNVQMLDRLGNNDYTANFGSYITLKDSYVHFETGFGWDIDYIYDFEAIAEYGRKLIKNLFWQMGYNYRMYKNSGDTHNIYPGLIYYFGDSYMSINYGGSWIESRDMANFGTVKGSFAITEFLRLYAGAAFGERLYDIYGLSAAKEKGYILFIGTNITFYKDISFRIGYIYGAEKPKFQKHGMHYGLMMKF